MKLLITCCLLLASSYLARADDSDSTNVGNNVLFFKDPRVDILQKIYCRKTAVQKGTVRVQVFQASSRDKVFEAKAQFSARFPGIQTYITYLPPNFKLRVGEFASHQEAFKFMQQTKSIFPASFVIEEKMNSKEDNSKASESKGKK